MHDRKRISDIARAEPRESRSESAMYGFQLPRLPFGSVSDAATNCDALSRVRRSIV